VHVFSAPVYSPAPPKPPLPPPPSTSALPSLRVCPFWAYTREPREAFASRSHPPRWCSSGEAPGSAVDRRPDRPDLRGKTNTGVASGRDYSDVPPNTGLWKGRPRDQAGTVRSSPSTRVPMEWNEWSLPPSRPGKILFQVAEEGHMSQYQRKATLHYPNQRSYHPGPPQQASSSNRPLPRLVPSPAEPRSWLPSEEWRLASFRTAPYPGTSAHTGGPDRPRSHGGHPVSLAHISFLKSEIFRI